MAGGGQDIAYYTLPVILSFDGVEKQANSKLAKVFGDAGKNANKSLSAGLKGSQADIDKAADSYTKLKNKAADALGKIRTEEAALQRLRNTGASDDRIIRQEEKLATARRNSITISRDAEKAHSSLKAAQGALGSSSDDLGGKMAGLTRFASGAGAAISAAGVVAAGAAVVGIGALAVGVAAAGRELYDLGAQFDDVFDNIRIKTGATGKQLEALQKSTENLSTKVPLSIADIGNVVAETSRALHLTGTDLDNVAGSIANLGRLTGENVDVRALGKAFRGFGVDVKDQVPALDSLLRANQSTGIGVNELIETVVKGGAGLRAFGFDFGESAALAGQFEEAGLDSTKALAGFTKGLATLAKDGQTGQQALRDNVTQIKALTTAGRDAEALDLTNKLFGAKGGAQFFEAIKSGALDLDTLADSMGNTGDTIADAAKDTDDLAERWQTFKNEAAVALEPLATGVFDTVNTQLSNLADTVSNNKPEIIGFFKEVGLASVSMAEFVVKSTGLFAQGFGELIAPIGDVVGGLLQAAAAVDRFQGQDLEADKLDKQAQSMFGLGEGLYAFGEKAKNFSAADIYKQVELLGERAEDAAKFTSNLGGAIAELNDKGQIVLTDNTPETIDKLQAVGIEVKTLPDGTITVDADTDEGRRIIKAWRDQENGTPISPPVKPKLITTDLDVGIGNYFANIHPTITPNVQWHTTTGGGNLGPGVPNTTGPGRVPRATGGPVFGAGTRKSDSIPAWLSNSEHVWTADEVQAAGGHGAVYAMRAAVMQGLAGGGIPLPLAFPLLTDDDRVRRNAGDGSRTRNRGPGSNPNEISVPDWSTPGQGWGDAPDWWWQKPIDPNDILFPDYWGQHPWGKHPLGDQQRKAAHPLGFAGGGAVGPDVEAAMQLVNTPYSKANRTDCSGMVARVIARSMGMPESGLMSTKNAADWLAARGFQPGRGGPGQISVGWYDHGPNPNDGHMAMTLSDGENAESGGGSGDLFTVGGGAAGADDPQFDQHMFLPQLFGEGAAGTASSGLSSGTGSTGGGGTPGIGPNGESGTYGAPDAKAVREADQKIADADFKVRQAELKLKELDADAKESQKQDALKDVEDAKREAADARTDAATTKQGKFTAGGAGGGKGGGPQLSEIGGIAKSFLTETFGLDGSWLPDIGNLAPLQMADTLLSALVPQFTGAGTGTGAPGAQTSSGAFGMPEIPAPGMPEGANHLGPNAGGLPGPTIINNDLSANFAGNVGQSWDEIRKQQEQTQQRGLARISGIPLAVGS